jgi:hypothetical protein
MCIEQTNAASLCNDFTCDKKQGNENCTKQKKEQDQREILSYFLHQNNLMWNRLQTVGVIQIGILGAGYKLRTIPPLAYITLCFGAILTFLVLLLFNRDNFYRERFRKELCPPLCWKAKKHKYALNGKWIARIMFGILIIADVALIMAISRGWISTPTTLTLLYDYVSSTDQ